MVIVGISCAKPAQTTALYFDSESLSRIMTISKTKTSCSRAVPISAMYHEFSGGSASVAATTAVEFPRHSEEFVKKLDEFPTMCSWSNKDVILGSKKLAAEKEKVTLGFSGRQNWPYASKPEKNKPRRVARALRHPTIILSAGVASSPSEEWFGYRARSQTLEREGSDHAIRVCIGTTTARLP